MIKENDSPLAVDVVTNYDGTEIWYYRCQACLTTLDNEELECPECGWPQDWTGIKN